MIGCFKVSDGGAFMARHQWAIGSVLVCGLTACQPWPSISMMGHGGGMMHHGHMRGGPSTSVDADTLPEKESAGAQTFVAFCQQCHALPDPKQHTAREWPSVVERMRGNMRSMGRKVADDREAQRIVEYLQRHAR